MVEYAATNEPEAQKRRSARIMQIVPLTVAGVDALGQPFKERTSTLIINCHGCKYSSKHYVLKGSWVTLEVPHSEPGREPRTVRAKVTWIQRPRTVRELFQVGVELEAPGNIWGIAFPPDDWFPFPEPSAPEIPAPGAKATPPAQPAARAPRPEPEEKLRELPRPAEPTVAPAAAPKPETPPGAAPTRAVRPAGPAITQLPAEIRQQIQSAVRETVTATVAAEAERLFHELSAQMQRAAEAAVQAAASAHTDQMIRRALEKIDEMRQASSAALREEWTSAFQNGLREASAQLEARLQQVAEPLRASFTNQLQEGLTRGSTRFEELAGQVKEMESAAGTRLAGAEARLGELRKEIDTLAEAVRANALGQERVLEEAAAKLKLSLANSFTPSSVETETRLAELRKEADAAMEAVRASVQAQMQSLEGRAEQLREQVAALMEDSRAAWREKIESDMTFAGTEWNTMLESAVKNSTERLASRLDSLSQAVAGRAEQDMTARAAEWIRQADGVAGEALKRLGPALQTTETQFLERLALQASQQLGPQVARAEEAARALEGAQEAALEVFRTQRNNLEEGAAEHARALRERLQQISAQLLKDFEEASRALEAKWLAELDEKQTEVTHDTFESLYKTSEWYQKKAHTAMQAALEKAAEEAGHRLREQAAEVARLFAAELDHHCRSFGEHTQALLEDAAKDVKDRVSAQLNEARTATAANFADEAHKVAHEKLRQLAEVGETAALEIRRGIEERLQQAGGQANAQIERSLAEFRQRLAQQLEADLAQGRERGEREWREAIALASNESVEEYKRRLQNASNAWMAAAVTTLQAHAQATLGSLAQGAEGKVREVFAQTVTSLMDTMRDRLLRLAAEINPPANPPEKEKT